TVPIPPDASSHSTTKRPPRTLPAPTSRPPRASSRDAHAGMAPSGTIYHPVGRLRQPGHTIFTQCAVPQAVPPFPAPSHPAAQRPSTLTPWLAPTPQSSTPESESPSSQHAFPEPDTAPVVRS